MNEVVVVIRLQADGKLKIETSVRDKILLLGLFAVAGAMVTQAHDEPAIVPIHQPINRLPPNGG